MSCECGPQHQRTYYSTPQLFSDPGVSGMPSGGGFPVGYVEVTVCTVCGKAEFQIPEETRKRFIR